MQAPPEPDFADENMAETQLADAADAPLAHKTGAPTNDERLAKPIDDANQPKRIGRYTVKTSLGRGAMGEVYLARDDELDRDVAIKIVTKSALDSEIAQKYLLRFKNEARAAAKLHHANIVQVYDVGEDSGHGPYLVFEYVKGKTLRELLREQRLLDEEQTIRLADELGSALSCAHEANIVHRDIKPENILIDENGSAKLADFGVARIPNAALTAEGQFLGTPCYSSPEALSRGEYSAASDIFSFAAVLFEAVSGERAYPGNDAMAVAQAIIAGPPSTRPIDALKNVPSSLKQVLLNGMAHDLDARFATGDALAEAIEAAYDGAFEPTAPQTSDTAWYKSPLGILVSISMVGLIAAAFIVFADPARPGDIEDGPPTLGDIIDDNPYADGDKTGGDKNSPVHAIETNTDDGGLDGAAQNAVIALPNLEDMSPLEKEQAAKDWIARTKQAIEQAKWDDATQYLKVAKKLDPWHAEIESLDTLISKKRN